MKRNKTQLRRSPLLAALAVFGLAVSGCHQDMWNQPYYKPLAGSDFATFENRQASRPAPEGRIAYQGRQRAWTHPVFAELTGSPQAPDVLDEAFYTGKKDGELLADNYFVVTRDLLERGRERYAITCLPCHGPLGDGQGFIPSRGFPNPPTYHQDRLRQTGDGHFFDVMTHGFGRMYSYASRQFPEDRWAITAYIRALQLSQELDPEALPPAAREAVADGLRQAQAGSAQQREGAAHGAHE